MTQRACVVGLNRWRTVAAVLVGVLAVSLLPSVGLAQPAPVEDPNDACPDEVNPPAPFTDRLQIPEAHRLNVDCAYNNDIALGFADLTYRPATTVRRDQFASFMVRTLEAADVDLPPATGQGFTDISGNVHEDNINILAATGITAGTSSTTYSPSLRLRRDQIASFVLRAVAFIEDVPVENLQRDSGPFTDVPSTNVHARNINGARALNLTIGRTADTYLPGTATRRDQMASFLVRLLAALREGPLIPGEDRAETLELAPQTATNAVGSEHTVTATVRDLDEVLVDDANVRFEVYRDTEDDGVFDGPVSEGMVRTDAQGVSSFSYTGPGDPAADVIVACAVRPEETCAVADTDDDTEGTQFTGQEPEADARVFDTAAKTWVEADEVEIPEDDVDAVNPLGAPHEITATARFDGEPLAGAQVRFEVYRAETADGTFTGPVESSTETTAEDGTASFTYSHDAEAVDRIVICVPDEDSCQVTDTDPVTDDTQFLGEPVVGAEPNVVATKTWTTATFPAESLTARAFGLDVTLLGLHLIEEMPSVAIALPPGDEAEETDEVLGLPLEPLVEAEVIEVAARGDRDAGFAQGEAAVTDLEVLTGDPLGDPLITADLIRVFSTSTCPEPGSFEEVMEGSQFVNVTVAGVELPLDPPPNTNLVIEGIAEVWINEVIPDEEGEGHGFTVRGLRVDLLDSEGADIVVAEAHSSVVCAEPEA